MNDPFLRFLTVARWTCAIVATAYHVRFLLFTSYGSLHDPNPWLTGFYFLTGLGHEAYAVYFILDGMFAGFVLQRQRAGAMRTDAAARRHVGALYRVVVPGLLAGACLDLGGARVLDQTGVYTAFPAFSTLSLTFPAFLGNLVMLQPFVVPEFGSNSMLYLPSWLFWSFVLLAVHLRTAALAARYGRALAWLPPIAALGVLPYQFLLWMAIWLAGVGLVFVCEARRWRPPLPAGVALFAAALVLSRLLGGMTAELPPTARDAIIQGGFLLVGLGFAVMAWTRYPRTRAGAASAHALAGAVPSHDRATQAASFAFFFHFPVIMLLAALGAASMDLPLMRQPAATVFAWFAVLVGASALAGAIVMGASARILRACATMVAARTPGRQ